MTKIVKILTLILIAASVCTNAYSQQISGVVQSGKTKLEGVIVSDGTNFARTDKKGRYTIDVASNSDFIFVITPSGYSASFSSGTPTFYKKIEKKKSDYNFDLQSHGSATNYTLVAIADPQPKTDEHFITYTNEIFPDIKQTVDEYKSNVVGIYLGDICWDAPKLYKPFKELTAKYEVPFYPVIGNHDHNMKIEDDNYKSEDMYRENFGPTYYAFCIGNDRVIVLDNIIYNARKNYTEAIDDKQLTWLKNYLTYVPKGSQLIIAMHAPMIKWWKSEGDNMIGGGDLLIDICKDYKVNVISGHTHRNHNVEVAENFIENNIAASNGSLWQGIYNTDGSPRGYKIFESDGNKLSWYYKSISKPKNYQISIADKGQSISYPNKVVAAVWDWDESWTVEWFEDGKAMGQAEKVHDIAPELCRQVANSSRKVDLPKYYFDARSHFYFAVSPSEKAKQIKFVVRSSFGKIYSDSINLKQGVDVQAHRGGMGLMPENTVEAMINAMNLGVNTLELDLNISADKQVLVSHDPWMNYKFVSAPDGSEITKENQKSYALYSMSYDSIAKYETGLKSHPDYSEQKKIKTHKPRLSPLIDACEQYCEKHKIDPLQYNIEIKSSVARDNVFSPPFDEFCDLAMEVLNSKNLGDRLTIQSFDVRALNYLHKKYPNLKLSYNVRAVDKNFEENMSKLDFVPAYYSPDFSIVDEELIEKCRKLGMKIVVWTVDKPADIQRMLDIGVDAIITNYPNRILEKTRGY